MIRPPRQPLLSLTPATGRIVRYAARRLMHTHGVALQLDEREIEVPTEWCTTLGRPDVWPLVESFRVKGTV